MFLLRFGIIQNQCCPSPNNSVILYLYVSLGIHWCKDGFVIVWRTLALSRSGRRKNIVILLDTSESHFSFFGSYLFEKGVWDLEAYSLLVANLGTTNTTVTDNYLRVFDLRNSLSQNFLTWTSVILYFINSRDYSMRRSPALSTRLRRMYRTCCFASVQGQWGVSSFFRYVKAKRVCRVTFVFSNQSFPPLFGQLHLLFLFD